MKMSSNKGFIIEGTLAIIFLIGAATLAVFTLTPAKNLVNLGGGDGKKTVQTQSYKETIEPYTEDGRPVKVKLSDGSEGLVFKRVVTSASLDETTVPKLTLWQKIKQIGWWWLGLTILGMFCAPVGFVMNAINKKAKDAALELVEDWKEKHGNLASETQKIVLSVDKGLSVFDSAIQAGNAMVATATQAAAGTIDPSALTAHNAMINTYQTVVKTLNDTRNSFLAAMSKKQDDSTKLLVKQLQQPTTPQL